MTHLHTDHWNDDHPHSLNHQSVPLSDNAMYKLTTPGQLIANIPGTLGFFPTESLVLIGASAEHCDDCDGDDGDDAVVLAEHGPILRVDIGDLRGYTEAQRILSTLHCTVVFAVIISKAPQRVIDELAEILYQSGTPGSACGAHSLVIDACWHVPDIAEGELYEQWFGPRVAHHGQPHDGWWSAVGRVPALETTPSFEALKEAGSIPASSREAYINQFRDSNRFLGEEECARLHEQARRIGADLGNEGFLAIVSPEGTEKYDLHDVVCDSALVCAEIAQEHAAALAGDFMDRASVVDALLADEELLFTIGLWLAHVRSRDVALAQFLAAPDAAALIMEAVVATFKGDIRANALVILGVCSTLAGHPNRFNAALNLATNAYPHHTLSRWVMEYYQIAGFDAVARLLKRGSEDSLTTYMEELGWT